MSIKTAFRRMKPAEKQLIESYCQPLEFALKDAEILTSKAISLTPKAPQIILNGACSPLLSWLFRLLSQSPKITKRR